MREWLSVAVEWAVILIDWLAVIIIVYGTVEAFARALPILFGPGDPAARRDVWLRYARWLVAGLTFLLAADIIETTITDDWQSIARIAAIAVIRTFLNYFLERDVKEVNEEEIEDKRVRRSAA